VFGGQPSPMFEVDLGGGRSIVYKASNDTTEDGATLYDVVGEFGADKPIDILHAVMPFTVHFIGGPADKTGRFFSADPAEFLILPLRDEPGRFAKYQRHHEQLPGRPLIYRYVKTFRGSDATTPREEK